MRLWPRVPELAIALAAAAVASAFAATVLRHAPAFALPLDDAYAYLTQARQLGRGELPPSGPGSVLWPLLLAPCWALGARDQALVWVSFGLCAALHAATCVGCYRLARELAGTLAGLVAAALVLAVMPLAQLALAGVEVALASALVVWTLLLHVRARRDGPPSRAPALCAAATALVTPGAAALAALAAGLALADRLRRRCWRDAAGWAVLLAAPALWLLLSAGEPTPPAGEGSAVSAAMSHVLEGGSLPWPRLTLVLWLGGALRVLAWASRARRRAAGVLVVAAPLVLVGASIASASMEAAGPRGARAIAPAIPLLLIGAACVLAPLGRAGTWARIGRPLGAAALAALWWWAGARALRVEPVRYARDAIELDRQAGQIGRYVRRELPGASILAHEAGAISYHGDVRVSPLLGAGEAARHGPGALFELLERLPPERRPTHLVSGAARPDPAALFGAVVLETFPARPPPRGHGQGTGAGLRLLAASWELAHTAERPLDAVPGWRVVDRVDVADLADERGHRHAGASGRRTVLHREARSTGLALDGGRTIRGGEERFTIELEPARPVRLLLRTGGTGRPDHDGIVRPATITVSTSAGSASATIAPPAGVLVEVAFELPAPPAREVEVRTAADGPYRAFHWFALQPE